MDSTVTTALAELNRAFYTRFAGDFARTRRTWPPGFTAILPYLHVAFNLLDLGCGNARLLTFLARSGWKGRYTGFDASAGLLAVARQNAQGLSGIQAGFVQADLLDAHWSASLAAVGHDAITLLAVLHHIPGADQRAHFVADCAACLAPGAHLVISTWQFMTSARLQARILPWSAAGLRETDVEPGDTLLAWGQDHAGQRYCAAIGEAELLGLASAAGLVPVAILYADGHEENLNLYGIFRRPA